MILEREKDIILSIYTDNATQTADFIARSLRIDMMEKEPLVVARHINEYQLSGKLNIGVVAPDGRPAFNTDITIPKEILKQEADTRIKSGDFLYFYKPLKNERSCQRCHGSSDKTRGMIVIARSLKEAKAAINETAKRLIFLAIIIGLISEVFLIVILRKMVLIPLGSLSKGADILKAGNLSHRINIKNDDEIGAVASCFNEMAESIEKAHINLEKAVRQKTKELRVIAELSLQVFKGNSTLNEIIKHFLDAIVDQMDYDYSVLCLIDKETGLLLQEFKRGVTNGFCTEEIPLAGNHPFVKVVMDSLPAVKKSGIIGAPDSYGNVVLIPILSHQRKRCKDINLCTLEECPAFDNPDERCWLINDTLCRSPQAVPGKEKIYGCLHCDVFPVLGILIAGKKTDITKTSLHSLEILASEIASAIENQRLIEGKEEDIGNLIWLHDLSVDAIQGMDVHALTESIVSSSIFFANMDAAALWLKDGENELYLAASSNLEKNLMPGSIPIDSSFVGRCVSENRSIETIQMKDALCFSDLIKKHGFRYTVSLPLKYKGGVYGCLSLFKRKDFFMTDSEKAIARLFSSQAAAAIHTAQIYNELRVEKEFSDAVFNNMNMGVMVIDKDGRITKLNQAGNEILNTEDNIAGKLLQEALPEAIDFVMLYHGMSREVSIRVGTNNIPVGFSNSPLRDENGEQAGIIVVFRDLTEIKKLQEEVRKKHHLEAMGKVIAGVAHEIRNPLFGISSLVQILEREVKSEQHQTLLHAMLKEIYRLKNLIEELLLYSRPSKLNIIETDLYNLTEKVAHYLKAKKDDVHLNLSFATLNTIRADVDKLTQVFLNLTDNAIGAGCKNIAIVSEKRDDGVAITITDDGIGIKKGDLDKIFDPFFTTKKEGTGLGLSICRKIIEDHGGTIEIFSSEGNGTKVELTFPAEQHSADLNRP